MKFHVNEVNLVAHSMGGVTVLDYLSHFSVSQKTATVAKVVLIGVPLNDGDPGKTTHPVEETTLTATGPVVKKHFYQHIFAHRELIDEKIQFLNIIGILPNQTNDGAVAAASAQSVRFLLANPQKQYQELVLVGWRNFHSLLHENRRVDAAIIKFLFNR